MKNHILLYSTILIVSILLFFSCKPKETIARLPKPEKPFIKMDLNGNPWEGNKIIYQIATSTVSNEKRILTGGGIYAMHNDTPVYYLEELALMLMKKKSGRQNIKYAPFGQIMQDYTTFSDTTQVYAGMGTSHQMGEMICEDFEVDDTKDNWVEIVQQEEDYKYIWGKFNLTMVRVRTCPTARYSDTVRITNGEFYIEQP